MFNNFKGRKMRIPISFLVILVILSLLLISSFEQNLYSATSCSAKADNGSKCSITCTEGIAVCIAGAKTVICQCQIQIPQPRQHYFELTPFATGERDYFVNQLKPFILSLNSERATALANALDQVILAVDLNDPNLYNDAEWNYHTKRAELTPDEREALDYWVSENAFYK